MDDQSFVSSDTYQADFDAGSQCKSPGRSASERWHTTNSSNTMELECHLSASSVSRDIRASSVSTQRHDDSARLDLTNRTLTQSECQFHESDGTIVTSDQIHDSREQMESVALMPRRSPGQVFGENGTYSNFEDGLDSSKNSQSGQMMSTPFLDPSLMYPCASRVSDHHSETSEQQEPANLMPAANIKKTYNDVRINSASDHRRGSSERSDPAHQMSAPGLERRGRSPSPRPKVSAETKARWAMLKQLAGVSQPHDVEEEDRKERRDEETRTAKVDIRIREEASVRDLSQTGDHADDASIERYLEKLQGDPYIDSRGLREGLSRMHSYKGSKGQQDQSSAHESHFEGDTHSGARRLSESTLNSGVENEMRREERDARNNFPRGEGEAEQALRGSEVGLRRNQYALGAGLQRTCRRAGGGLRPASRDARGHLQKDKQMFEQEVRRDASTADADMHTLGGQTVREFRSGEHGLEAGLQGAAHAAENLSPQMNFRQDLRRGEQDLMGDAQKAENEFQRTGLGQKIRRGEHDLMEDTHKLEHAHIGLRQEFRKGEANLMGDIHKVENEIADTGLGQEVRKGEYHLLHEFHKLEHESPHLALGQDLRRGEYDLKQGLHEAGDHLRRDEHALGRGAEAAGRSVEHMVERVGRLAVEGATIAGGLGMMALDHARSGNRAPSPRPNVPQPGRGMMNPDGQRMPNTTHQAGAGGPRPPGAPGPHPASNNQRPNQPPANHLNRPSIVEPPRHPPTPHTPQPSHDGGPSGGQQPHLSPILSPARAPSPGPAMNKTPGNNQRSQMPIRKPVLPPRPQGSPQQRPPIAVPPHPQPQNPQAAPQQPPQVQIPKNAPQHPSNSMPQHFQSTPQRPPQPQRPQGASQHPENKMSQHPHAQRAPQERQPPKAMPQHPPHHQPLNAPQPPPNAMSSHPQPAYPHPHPQGGPQQSQHPDAVPVHPQPPHPQGGSQLRQPASAMPQHPPPSHPQGALKQRSQSPMPPRTQRPQVLGPPQQVSQGAIPPQSQISNSQGAPQQEIPHAMAQPPPQHSQGIPQSRFSNDRREGEVKRPEAMPNINVQQTRQAITGAGAGSHLARTPPTSNEKPESEAKMAEQEPRASIMQERRRRAAESQRRPADRQEQQNRNYCRHEDHDAESCLLQTEFHTTIEHAEESCSISGHQSMLNMFRARADAAIEASGDCPSFTDRKSHPVLMMSCSVS